MVQIIVQIPRLLRCSPRLFFSVLGAFVFIAGIDPALLVAPSATSAGMALHKAGFGVLSEQDQHYYRDALRLQQEKRYIEADAALSQINDPILKADVLAARNVNVDSSANAAATIASTGYERSLLRSGTKGEWNAALADYRKQDMASAFTHFKHLLESETDLPQPDRAAAAFWAYRTSLSLGNQAQALEFAQTAAAQPPGFYSILARRVLAQQSAQSPESQLGTMAQMLERAPVRHAIALKEVGQDKTAEQELRDLFAASANDNERQQLINLADLLDLPAARMHMALDYTPNGEEARELQYPMPRWTPTSGYKIEPALLYAIMRQESGFNPNAHSASGALGVMQLMPETAHEMARAQRIFGRSASQPAVSMALGQGYLERLMQTPAIGDNLVYLTAAYNAGPGTLAGWQRNLHCESDPLLFIESIPYEETREYVVNVMGNYWIYSDLFGGHDTGSAARMAENKWPRYAGSEQQLTSMLSHPGDGQVE